MHPFARFFRSPKRRNRFFCVTAMVLVLAVFLTIGLRACTAWNQRNAGSTLKELQIDDRYEGKKLIPKYNVPRCTYQDSKFSTDKNGVKSYAQKNASKGIDVSSWQGDINWKKVRASGFTFAMIRVGYRGQTQGSLNEDPKFRQNMAGALAAGLRVGAYFFSQAVTEREAQEEADFVRKRLAPYRVTWPVVFDWEVEENRADSSQQVRTQAVTPEEATRFVRAFCEKIRAAGYRPAYYSNKNMGYSTFNLEILKPYSLWYAEYRDLPSFYYQFAIWQYSDKGKVNGISTPVDLNLSFQNFESSR